MRVNLEVKREARETMESNGGRLSGRRERMDVPREAERQHDSQEGRNGHDLELPYFLPFLKTGS